jgi:hypothetical protein
LAIRQELSHGRFKVFQQECAALTLRFNLRQDAAPGTPGMRPEQKTAKGADDYR